MGADILTRHNPDNNSQLFSLNQSKNRIHFTSSSYPYQNNLSQSNLLTYTQKDFRFTQQSLTVLFKQQIVQNNFSQQFDPLFTTFRPENKNIYGKFRILCSNITNQKIQQYKISFRNQNQFRIYVVSYFWRKHHAQSYYNDWPLVKTTNLKIYQESKRMLKGGLSSLISSKCSSSKQIYCRLYVQDIPLRLCHIKDIPFPQNLYVLRQVLKGFHIIYQNIGYIKPFEDLICITRKGLIKVWINSDLSKNFPNIQNIDDNITSTKSESKLINQILHIVMNNTDPSGQPIQFTVFLKQHYINTQFITFEKIFEMIQKYQMNYGIQIPDTFASIVEVLNQQEEEYDTYRTEMEHVNDDKVESSQPIRSQRRNGSGLLLDVPHQSSRLKSNRKNQKQKPSSSSNNSQSNPKHNSRRKNKTHKTQSLKIGQKQRNSLQSSVCGAKSNILLSQSVPISSGINQQPSSNEINGSGISNNNVSRSRQEQSSSQIQKLSEGNFTNLERECENNCLEKENMLVARENKHYDDDNEQKHVSKSSIPFGKVHPNEINHQPINQQSNHSINHHHHILQNHHLNPSSSPYAVRSSQPCPLPPYKQQTNQNHYTSQDYSLQFHSNNQILLSDSQHASEFFKNKKTYSNLWDRKLNDKNLLDDQDDNEESESMVIRVDATEQERQQMIQIDKFIEAEVMKEEEQKFRLSQMYKSRNQLLNKSQQLTYQKNSKLINQQQTDQYTRLNLTTVPILPATNKQTSSHVFLNHKELQIPQILSSHQKKFSNTSQLHNNMHSSSHHVQYMDDDLSEGLVMMDSSKIVLGEDVEKQKQQHNMIKKDSDLNGDNIAAFSNDLRLAQLDLPENSLSPHSRETMNQNQRLLQFQQCNTYIEIQPPSSSSRNGQNSSNILGNNQESQEMSQNLSPYHQVMSSSSNQVFVPAIDHQLLVSNNSRHNLLPPPLLVSSTSIGNSIFGHPQKQSYFPANNMIASSPMKKQLLPKPQVTFTLKTPEQQKISFTNFQSSKTVSINQLPFSQQQVPPQAPSSNKINIQPLQIQQENSSSENMNRLSYRAQTMVSAYVQSQWGNMSSRKYYQQEERDSSSYSKPSIVEYSYLKNPEIFGNVQSSSDDARIIHQNSQIAERSMDNSLQKIPRLSVEFIPQVNSPQKISQASFKRPQINNHYSYYQGQQMLDIVPIPQQMQSQMFNNSRSLVNNNDDCFGSQSISGSVKEDHCKQQIFQTNMQKSSPQNDQNSPFVHKRQPTGFRATESLKQEISLNHQGQQSNHQQNLPQRKQSYFISQEYSISNEDQIKSQFGNQHHFPELKIIKVRPSVESQSGCSQRVVNNNHHNNKPFLKKSHLAYSKQQNRSSFISGQQKKTQQNNNNRIAIDQIASDQGSNLNDQARSGYRVVESIEENRPNSAYQMDVDVLEKDGDFVKMDEASDNVEEKRHINSRLTSKNNLPASQHNPQNPHQKASPTQSQKQSPLMNRFPQKPVTGRTMFMNNQNQLLSQLVDPQSQLQSQVDYTYNSYDKWKDKSKVLDFGPSRFRQFDNQKLYQQQGGTSGRKFANIVFSYPDRHQNHKQLVKSSIEGMKLLNHQFINHKENFIISTDKKQAEVMKESYDLNQKVSNRLFYQINQHNNRMQFIGFKMVSQYQEDQIDQEILNDLTEFR